MIQDIVKSNKGKHSRLSKKLDCTITAAKRFLGAQFKDMMGIRSGDALPDHDCKNCFYEKSMGLWHLTSLRSQLKHAIWPRLPFQTKCPSCHYPN